MYPNVSIFSSLFAKGIDNQNESLFLLHFERLRAKKGRKAASTFVLFLSGDLRTFSCEEKAAAAFTFVFLWHE